MNEKGEIFLGDFPPEMITKVDGAEEFTLQFNSEQCSYDYGWKSNRWSGPLETHVIDIICVKQLPNDIFKICSSCSSDPFVVLSNHKRRIQTKPESKRGLQDASQMEESKKPQRKKFKIEMNELMESTTNDGSNLSECCSASVESLSSASSLHDEEGSMAATASILTMLSNTMDKSKYLFDKVYLQQQAVAASHTPREQRTPPSFYQHRQQQRDIKLVESSNDYIVDIPTRVATSTSHGIPCPSISNDILFSTSAHRSHDTAFLEWEYMNSFW